LHEVFGLNNDVGLTSLLFVNPSSNGSTPKRPSSKIPDTASVNLLEILHSTDIPRLRVITSGFTPSNPSEILGSALMQHWIEEFLAASNIDVILIDTPPCLMVADSSILASTTNADVILVVEAGRTRRAAAAKAREEFERVGRPITGVVVNGVNPIDEYYHYYGYGYDYAGYYQEQGPKPPKWRFWLR
ncbi:MAG: hypothetical protein H7175_15470, partial [Burkholderiales bacterium]|nr:hypothetical protein [Anaerolineae bacterium]